MSYWKNKVVVITGGSAGFGRELAAIFLQQQATVALVARDAQKLQQVSQELGENAFAFPADAVSYTRLTLPTICSV